MDIEEIKARLKAIVDEMRAIDTAPEDLDDAKRAEWSPSEDDLKRFGELKTEADDLKVKLAGINDRQQAILDASEGADAPTVGGSTGERDNELGAPNQNRQRDPWDIETLRFQDSSRNLRERVTTGLEGDDVTPDEIKEAALRTISTVRTQKGGNLEMARKRAALLCIATGSAAYRSAFAKVMQNRAWAMTPEESAIAERAQSLTDAAGGFAIPFTLDPTIIFTNASAINPMRRIAKVVTTMTDQWQGVTGGAAQFSWDGEATEASDDSITLDDVPIPVRSMNGFIPFSMEIGADWADIDSDLRMAMQEGRDELEAEAHISGNGTTQPRGLETALVAAGGTAIVPSSVAAAFSSADVYALQNQLAPRHRMNNPKWIMDIGTSNAVRQFDTAGGGNFWASLAPGAPPSVLGWAWEETSAMDSTADFSTGGAPNSGTYYPLCAGDFSRFIVVDRMGMILENIPHLFGANQRPTGQRGLYAKMRSGSDVADPNAFKMLRVIIS